MITGQVSEAEFLAAHCLHRRRIAVGVYVALSCLAVAGVLVFLVASRKWGVMLVFAALGGAVGEAVQSRVLIPRRLRKLYVQRRGRTDVTWSWTADTLSLRSEYGTTDRPWSHFVKVKENEDLILLYFDDAVFLVVSKRWFQSPGQLEDFRARLNLVR